MKKKIIAFAGSNSYESINKQLVKCVLSSFNDYEHHLLDLNDFEMPIYSIDREKHYGIPAEAQLFAKHMQDSDAIICSLAENNQNYSVAFKNIFDWCSRIDMKVFADKPMLLLSTSPGRFGGGNVMQVAKHAFPMYGAELIETFSLPSFNHTFRDNDILDTDLRNDLLAKIEVFKKALASN